LHEYSTPIPQSRLQPRPEAIHLDTWLARNRDGNDRVTEPQPLSFLKRHDVNAIDDDIFMDVARLETELVQHASRNH
jgi:hypothetical protein